MKTTGKTSAKACIRSAFKHKKLLITVAVILAAAVTAATVLPEALGRSGVERITTYEVEEITYGNVSQTISGSGTLTPITQKTVTSEYGGEVKSTDFTAGDEVTKSDVLAVITTDGGDKEIKAPFDGVLIEFPLEEGDSVSAGDTAALVMGKDGFTMGIAVDELNISSVEKGQDVTFTVDAADGEYTGSVTEISYNGSTSGGTTAYQVTAQVEYLEGVYPGMSASCEIVIEDSGEGLIVPVDAVSTSGDDSYVYLAPSGAEAGDSYEEGDINTDKLTKVNVETGMSDGSYIMIESDELSEGDFIVITKITSTQTGSEGDEENGGMGAFGGMGELPEGMDFGDFDFGDFEDFDPSQMPSGGGFGGFSG